MSYFAERSCTASLSVKCARQPVFDFACAQICDLIRNNLDRERLAEIRTEKHAGPMTTLFPHARHALDQGNDEVTQCAWQGGRNFNHAVRVRRRYARLIITKCA